MISAVMNAIKKGDIQLLNSALSSEGNLNGEQCGIDGNKSNYGHTLLRHALMANFYEAIPSLWNKGARDDSNFTILHHAAQKGDEGAVCTILDAKLIDVNKVGLNGKTPLHYAAQAGQKSTFDLLLSRGAFTNIEDASGKTPVDYMNELNANPRREKLLAFLTNRTTIAVASVCMVAALATVCYKYLLPKLNINFGFIDKMLNTSRGHSI